MVGDRCEAPTTRVLVIIPVCLHSRHSEGEHRGGIARECEGLGARGTWGQAFTD